MAALCPAQHPGGSRRTGGFEVNRCENWAGRTPVSRWRRRDQAGTKRLISWQETRWECRLSRADQPGSTELDQTLR